MSDPVQKPVSKLDVCKALYSEGAFDVSIAKELGLTIQGFSELCDSNPSFNTFVQAGRTLSMAWWYDQCRRNLKNKEFNVTLWTFVMKNQFGWADKIETKAEEIANQNVDDLRAKVDRALAGLAKSAPELVKQLKAAQ